VLPILPLESIEQWETRAVLKQAAEAHRYLAELKGVAATIPNEEILINTLNTAGSKAQLGNRKYHYHSRRSLPGFCG